jgi:hypothetical protein
MALAWVVSCSAATPKPERAPLRPSEPSHARLERELYAGKLLYLLRHGWREPAELRAPPMSLRATTEVEVSAQGMFMRYRLARSSGNALFDQSVTDHLQTLIDSGARAESGPPYAVANVFGETLTVLFTGPPAPGTPPY